MKPSDAPAVARILRMEFLANPAPVVDFLAAQQASPFKILVATILSARTRDDTTALVIRERLFPKVSCMDDLRRITEDELAQLIRPVGFFRDKARHLKALPDAVDSQFGGRIPDTVEELCALPGVGRKTANLVVAQAFGKPAVCVDVHVHRISNRLGLVETRTPFETETALRQVLPVRLWREWNGSLVSFGQRRCTPRNPKCDGCPVARYCSRIGVAP